MTVKQPVYTPSQGIRGSDPIINAAEDLMSLAKSPNVDTALQAASSAVDAATSVVGSMTSPIQAGVSFATRLALEYVYPLNKWMNELTGDSAQVNGIGMSWQSVSESLSSIADELESSGQSAMAEMSGESVSAYLMRQGQVVNATVASRAPPLSSETPSRRLRPSSEGTRPDLRGGLRTRRHCRGRCLEGSVDVGIRAVGGL